MLDRRAQLIAQMRLESATAQAAPPRPVPGQAVPGRPAPVRPPGVPLGAPLGHGPVPARPGWGLQTILQVLGAVLLCGAGLVFTVFAWGHLSMAVRGLILVAITAAVFAGAHWAARTGLKTAAEVVAGLGSFLVVLDAWVLWTAAVGTQETYAELGTAWTVALVVSAVVLIPLGRALALVTVSLTGLVCLTAAPAVLALTISSAPGSAALLALCAVLCLYAPQVFGPQVVVAGVSVMVRARVVLASLAPYYVGASSIAVLVALLDVGATQSVAPLLALAVVCGLWAAAAGPGARRWSAATGYALVAASTVGAVALTPTATSAAVWTLPLGAAVGCGATVGVLRALPRVGAPAARAAWTGVLLVGAFPVFVVAVLALDVVSEPAVLREAGNQEAVLPTLVGLGVIVAARPLLHLLGAQPLIMRPQVAVPAGPVPLPGQHPSRPQSVTVPRRPSVLVDHPLGASVIAATLLLLGLALVMPGAGWATATLLVVALSAAVARASLIGWIASTSAAMVPVRAFSDRITSVMQVCVGLGSAVAVTGAAILSFALAAGADSSVSRTTGQSLVAATFLVAGLVLWVAREWLPASDAHRVANRAALTGASLIISSVGVGIVARLVIPLDAVGWYAAPFPLVLALVLLGVRDRARTGQGSPLDRPVSADRLAALWAAALLCAPGFFLTALRALTDPGTSTATGLELTQSLAVALLATALLVTTAVLVWQLSFARAVGAHLRLRATAGALLPLIVALTLLSLRTVGMAAELDVARIDWLLAILGLLAVLVTWAGAATSGPARLGFECSGVALAATTTLAVVVVAQGDPSRVTIALAIDAIGTLAYAMAARRPQLGWLALCLGVAASWVSLNGSGLPVEIYTAPGATVMLATGVWQLVASQRSRRSSESSLVADPGSDSRADSGPGPGPGPGPDAGSDPGLHAARLILGGLTVLIVPSVLLTPGAGNGGRALVVAVGVVWLGATAWLLTRTAVATRLRLLVTGMTVLGLAGAVVGLGGYGVALATRVASGSSTWGQAAGSDSTTALMTTVWTAAAVAATAVLAALLTQMRFQQPVPPGSPTSTLVSDPRVWAVTVCTALAALPVLVLVAGGWFGSASTRVCAAAVIVWGAAALLGTPPGLPRVRTSRVFLLRAVPALIGAYVTALIGAGAAQAWSRTAASSAAGAAAGEGGSALAGLLILAGVFVAVVTVRAAQVDPTRSTWTTVMLGAVATLLPLTVEMLREPSGGRVAAAMVTAAVWLVLGVRLRWQAPVACGIVALLVQVVALVGPPALAAMSGMLGWMVLAVVGGTLLALGLTYERQIATARKVLLHYSELR